MAEHNKTGRNGEEGAIAYLRQKGYSIIETNWRFGKEEIDIIADHPDYLAIVEVKTRTSDNLGTPQTFVSRKKQKHLIRAAHAYTTAKEIQKNVYFDIIAITLQPEYKLVHLHQAFYP